MALTGCDLKSRYSELRSEGKAAAGSGFESCPAAAAFSGKSLHLPSLCSPHSPPPWPLVMGGTLLWRGRITGPGKSRGVSALSEHPHAGSHLKSPPLFPPSVLVLPAPEGLAELLPELLPPGISPGFPRRSPFPRSLWPQVGDQSRSPEVWTHQGPPLSHPSGGPAAPPLLPAPPGAPPLPREARGRPGHVVPE